MDHSAGYREGIEDSIRRCEELLALTPLAFVPAEGSISTSRRGPGPNEPHVAANKACAASPKMDASAEKVWKRNMDLLSGGALRSNENLNPNVEPGSGRNKTDEAASSERPLSTSCQRPCSATKSSVDGSSKRRSPCEGRSDWDSEWSGTSSEWTLDRMCRGHNSPNQGSGCQVDSFSTFSDKSMLTSFTSTLSRPVTSLEAVSPSGQESENIESKEIETSASTKANTGTRDADAREIPNPSELTDCDVHDRNCPCFGEYKTETSSKEEMSSQQPQCLHCILLGLDESSLPGQSQNACSQGESTSALQASASDVSEPSQGTDDSVWDTSDRPTSSGSGQKTDTAISLSSGQDAHHNSFHSPDFKEKPRSKSTPRDISRGNKVKKHHRSKSVSRERFEDRLQTLARPRTEVYKKLAELKAMLEKEKLQECSFKPLVGRKPDPESSHSAPICERILEMQQRLELRKRARKAYEKEEVDNCSFWPRVNWRSQFFDKITYQPIQERFQELQRQKFEKIANAQLRNDLGLTFKPEINPKSIQLCKQKGLETIHVAERLTSMQRSVHPDCKLDPEKNKSTFAPEINKNTDYIIASSRQFGGCSVGFLERQKQYLQTMEDKKLQKSKKQETTPDLTFRPDIGNSAIILRQSYSHDLLQETPVERFERLAYRDKEQLWHARERIAEAYYSQFQFQPEIDQFSRILAGHTSIDHLYRNEKGRKVKEALEQAAQNEFQQKCPFRPEVNSTTRKTNSSQLQSLILQRRQLRKEKANYEQESRTQRELEELKECTFKPCVNPSPPKETASATIKGLERHLELQCIAKQMKREQEELERKVFFSHAYSLPMRQYTIPRPFVLQTAQGRCHRRSQEYA